MDSDLFERAQQSYERGRLRRAVGWSLPALGLVLASGSLTGSWTGVPIGVFLALLLVGFVWRGQALGRAVVPGLFAGSLGWSVPMFWACSMGTCRADCTTYCAGISLVGGLLAAGLVWRSGHQSALGALAIAGCCAAMGCLPLGLGGLVGLLALVVLGLPAALPQLRVAT